MDVLTSMRTYATVVASGSFTVAAGRLGISKSLASKYVGQLEARLGIRLLHRTTRKLSVTESGQAYYLRCRQLLEDFDELEAAAMDQQKAPQGHLRASAPTNFGEMYLTPAVAGYLDEQPGVSVELVLTDRYVDLVDEGFDLAVRIGELADSSLIARRLAPMHITAVASPAYLARAGTPRHPRELAAHQCIVDTNVGANAGTKDRWPFQEAGQRFSVRVNGRFRVNNALAARDMALRGHGIALCPAFVTAETLRGGHLQRLLPEFELEGHGIYAVYPHHRHLAAKTRSFVDFLMGYYREALG
ncbi:MAG: LysR family transcriptional regulator [Gammaproteobacteria bacterium]|nr:LysR family transcriptional regulator [Gammaproteobacteria bacterium]